MTRFPVAQWAFAAAALFPLAAGWATTRHVWQNSPSPNPPYSSWATAAHTVQAAVDVANANDTVLVTNGIYTLSQQLNISKGVTVRSVNPTFARLDANYADRCVYMNHAQAQLVGFFLEHGRKAADGGGIYIDTAGGIVSNCWLVEMQSQGASGGAIFCNTTGLVTDCTIQNSEADAGGGLYCHRGGRVDNALIENCYAHYNGGGALLYQGGTLGNTWLVHNRVEGNNHCGGGVYGFEGGLVENCTLSFNVAVMGGGACFYNGGTLRASNVFSNQCDRYGGGVAIITAGTVTDCSIHDNDVTNGAPYGLGGGVYCLYGGLVENSCISSNFAGDRGGGATLEQGGTLRNCLLELNVSWYWGGGVHCKDGGLVENTTIARNTSDRAGGIFLQGTNAAVRNCIVVDNGTWTFTSKNGLAEDPDRNTFVYSCTWPTSLCTIATGNLITTNVNWVNKDAGDYRLRPDSPCRDAGTNQNWMLTARDLGGLPRIWNQRVDMGAYEYRAANLAWALLLLP